MASELEKRAVVNKTVNLSVEEARRLWEVCQRLGHRTWASCLRHLLDRCLETRCWEVRGGG
jgi:hypothetical protein